jgi:hypothetical protein
VIETERTIRDRENTIPPKNNKSRHSADLALLIAEEDDEYVGDEGSD